MDKYKLCPSCGEKNDTGLFECLLCETDLTRIKITDDESERLKEEQNQQLETTTTSNSETVYRVCECGTNNPPNGRKCSACGEDISDIIPMPITENDEGTNLHFVFKSINEQYIFELKETVTIGRESAMSEYLNAKSYVSRIHAKLFCEIDRIFIENLSNTNFTYVNQTKIFEKTLLQDGDLIGLGGTHFEGNYQEQAAYFQVEILSCM